MKKLLIATTALVMTAGMASAEVSLKGDARFGLRYNNATTIDGAAVVNSTVADYRARVTFNMSGTTDSGMGFGASFRADNAAAAAAGGAGTAWISGNWGKLTVGAVDAGSDSVGLGIADVGYNGLGVDDLAEGLYAASKNNVAYTNSFGAFSVGASYGLATSYTAAGTGDWSLGLGYDGGTFKAALGFDSAAGVDTITVGGGVKMDAISANVIYSMPDVGNDAWGVDFGYALNSATSLTVVYADNGTNAGYGVGVAHNLGGGAKLIGGIGSVQRTDTNGTVAAGDDFQATDTKAELGLTFSF
jgi:outer membrane protein OmpU